MNSLKLKKPMMHGPAVKRLQEMGDLLGFDFGPNDGVFGEDTERVVKALQRRYKLKEDGICGPQTWRAVLAAADRQTSPGQVRHPGINEDGLVNIVGLHKPPKLYSHKRPLEDINTVLIHQTGCEMPSTPMGWRRLNAHLGMTEEGLGLIVNDFTDMIWHAQGLSAVSIGLETEGNFYGIDGKKNTLWKGGGGPDHLTRVALKNFENMFVFLCRWFETNQIEWKYIHAHRQSHKSRPADPGQEIWQEVAMKWIQRLGISDAGPDFFSGSGKPIPREWNPKYKKNKYWK